MSRRERRNAELFQRLVREEIVAIDGFIPQVGRSRTPRNFGFAVFGPLGIGGDAKQAKLAADKSLQRARRATTSAGKFPHVPCSIVLTPTRFVATDVPHTGGRPTRIVAEYELDDVESLTKLPGSFLRRYSLLSFSDSSSIRLESPRGGGYKPDPFREQVEQSLKHHRQSDASGG